MRILKPFMLLAVIGVLYSCAAVPLQTYRNGYIMDKNNVVVGSTCDTRIERASPSASSERIRGKSP